VTRAVPATYWALIGKEPGTKDDYSILREGPRRADGHENRAWAAIPSTPQLGGAPGPGRLPWVTFTPYTAAGQRWIAATVIEATRHRDAVGRPVVSARYVELPFAEFADGGTTYTALRRAVPEAAAMKSADLARPPLLDLGAADSNGAVVARALADRATFDHAARVACLLLAGEVLITVGEADLPSLDDRLALFDRVLALLPCGVRAGVTIASWQDGTGSVAFRLAYGMFADHGQPVAGHAGHVRPPSGGVAGEYLRLLTELRERYGTARIVEHLAAHRWPLLPTGANAAAGAAESRNDREALEILRCLSDVRLAVAAARSGTGSADRLAVAWLSGDERIDQRSLDDLESRLLQMGGGRAAAAVLPRWSERTATLAAAVVLGELAAGASPRDERAEGQPDRDVHGEQGPVQARRWSPAAFRLRAYAAQCDAEDSFLRALVDGWRAGGAGSIPAEPVAACMDGTPPGDGELPGVRLALLGAPDLARVLLRLSLRRDPAARPDLIGELREAVRGGLLGSLPSTVSGAQLDVLTDAQIAPLINDQLNVLDPAATAWIGWLDPADADAPAWLARYAVLAAPPRAPVPVAPADGAQEDLALIAWLAVRQSDFSALAAEWWPPLFRLARTQTGTGGDGKAVARVHAYLGSDSGGLAPEWWPPLIHRGSARAAAGASSPGDGPVDILATARARADLRRLAALARTLRLGGADPLADARADTLRLYLGRPPAHHPAHAGTTLVGGYLDALWTVWSELPADADSTALTLLLLSAVFGPADWFGPPSRDPVDWVVSPDPVIPVDPLGAFAVMLLLDVVLDDRVPFNAVIADKVAEIVSANPALLRHDRLTSDWWARVERLRPDVRDPARRLRVAVREAVARADQDGAQDREEVAGVAVLSGLTVAGGSLTVEELAAIIRPLLDRQPPQNREALFRVISGTLRLEADRNGGQHAERDLARDEATLFDLLGVQDEQRQGRLRRRRSLVS